MSPVARQYTDEDMTAALRQAARIAGDGVLTPGAYQRARESAIAAPGCFPSHRSFCIRFGSWSEALKAAGLPSSGRKTRSDYITPAICRLAVGEFLTVTEPPHTARAYDTWARTRADTPNTPSLSIVRDRLGTWSNAVASSKRSLFARGLAARK